MVLFIKYYARLSYITYYYHYETHNSQGRKKPQTPDLVHLLQRHLEQGLRRPRLRRGSPDLTSKLCLPDSNTECSSFG